MQFPLFVISLDPAQLKDWSAISVVKMYYAELTERFEYDLVAMARKQGLPYDKIVDWARDVYKKPAFNKGNGGKPPFFVTDATGVGVAVNDMLHTGGIWTYAVTITQGESKTGGGYRYHVGKARLIGKFLGAFDSGKVHINPNMPIWPLLEKEMLAYRAEMSSQGRAKFEAEEGQHDDMIFSLAQNIWFCEEVLRGAKL